MAHLTGTYECKLDSKGRIALPIAFKKQLEEILEDSFIVKRSIFQDCLEIYPMKEWEDVMSKLNKLNRFVRKNNDFIRMFTSGVKNIELDSNGRLQISKDLIEYAKLTKELVLSANINIIEIWDKDSYEKAVNKSQTEISDLAEEVMGNYGDDHVS